MLPFQTRNNSDKTWSEPQKTVKLPSGYNLTLTTFKHQSTNITKPVHNSTNEIKYGYIDRELLINIARQSNKAPPPP